VASQRGESASEKVQFQKTHASEREGGVPNFGGGGKRGPKKGDPWKHQKDCGRIVWRSNKNQMKRVQAPKKRKICLLDIEEDDPRGQNKERKATSTVPKRESSMPLGLTGRQVAWRQKHGTQKRKEGDLI